MSLPSEQKLLPPGPQPSDPEALANAAAAEPIRQLGDLPKDELAHLAEELGLEPGDYRSRQELVTALHHRRQLIAGLDRDAMLEVIRWGRRPVAISAPSEQLAREIVAIRSMKFSGLSQRGLVVLAKLRGLDVADGLAVPELVKRLKKNEGLFAKLNRKRRSAVGSLVANLLGEEDSPGEYRYLPNTPADNAGTIPPPRPSTIKQEIEESGLLGGISNRIKKTADAYLDQKLDEIEARIDRKLDEIDRRLAEWRDKEIANRIRILKITLWASVIICIISLLYTYAQVYFPRR